MALGATIFLLRRANMWTWRTFFSQVIGGIWGKTSPNFEGSYGIVQKAQFKNVDPFFSSNLRTMKRDVRKLRKDSLLSEFSSHVVLGSKKF